MRVVVAGGGKVGRYIAAELSGQHDIHIIEQDADVVERAKANDELAAVTWHVGDACEVSTLTAVRLEEADVVAAVTGDDEDNLVVSLLAKQEFAVQRVLARVNHPNNEWLFHEGWGVDVAVSTPHLLTALVEEAVSVGTLVRLLQFEGGRARLVVVTLADGAPATDQRIADLPLPRSSTVVAILRQDHVVMPRGDVRLMPHDEVLVLVTPDSEADVRGLLVGE